MTWRAAKIHGSNWTHEDGGKYRGNYWRPNDFLGQVSREAFEWKVVEKKKVAKTKTVSPRMNLKFREELRRVSFRFDSRQNM